MLYSVKDCLISHGLKLEDPLQRFFILLQEWIEYCIDGAGKISQLETQLSLLGSDIIHWVRYIKTHEPSLNSLLYRHYLFDKAMEYDVSLDLNNPGLHLVLGSMIYPNLQFMISPDYQLWDLEEQPFLINHLRKALPDITVQAVNLANRADVTDKRLENDHALLSTHSFFYALYLIRVILIYEQTVRPTKPGGILLSELTHVLISSKGVLLYVEEERSCTHV